MHTYPYKITEVQIGTEFTIIYFTWIKNEYKNINDMLFIHSDGDWSIRFDYGTINICKSTMDLYLEIIELTKTEAFKTLYYPKDKL